MKELVPITILKSKRMLESLRNAVSSLISVFKNLAIDNIQCSSNGEKKPTQSKAKSTDKKRKPKRNADVTTA